MLDKTERAISEATQTDNKLWWEKNPMGYDWHRHIRTTPGSREFFEEIDRRFFSSSPFYRGQRPFEQLIPFHSLKGKRVLEIGCGLGAHAQLLAEAGCDLTCIDLTWKAVEMTQTRLAGKGLLADVKWMDAEQMSFPDAQFDFVWSWGVIHHSANTERIVREVHRVLKPSGEFRFMVYHRRSFLACTSMVRGLASGKVFKGMSVQDILSFYSDGYLARFYTRSEIVEMLGRCGFPLSDTHVLGQKSELLPLPGKGASGRVKSALLTRFSDRFAERLLSAVGSFLFVMARRGPH
jgi:2-polyprenyl-3-methyl-5-hydroxy-6-metoxy-1,4-benzoquinol methylase